MGASDLILRSLAIALALSIGAQLTVLPWPVPRWIGVSAATPVVLMLCGSGPVMAAGGAVLAAVIAVVAPLPTSPARRRTAWWQSLALVEIAVLLALLLGSLEREVLALFPIVTLGLVLYGCADRDRRRVEPERQERRMLGHALLETYSTDATAGWFWLGARLWRWERIADPHSNVPRLVVWTHAIKRRQVFDCRLVQQQPAGGERSSVRIDAVRSQEPIEVLSWLTEDARRQLKRTLGISPERVAALISLSLSRGPLTEGRVSVLSVLELEVHGDFEHARVRLVGTGGRVRVWAMLTDDRTVVDLVSAHPEDDDPLADQLGAS